MRDSHYDVVKLYEAILALETPKEAQAFFRDLLTENEIAEFARRWKAARMLHAGHSYKRIQKETGLSSTTIARISTWLHSGMEGYTLILNRLNHHSAPTETS